MHVREYEVLFQISDHQFDFYGYACSDVMLSMAIMLLWYYTCFENKSESIFLETESPVELQQ